jgi:hypothetical protein
MTTRTEIEAAAKAFGCQENSLNGKLLKAALEAADRACWQPIETAPEDEMFIYYWPRDGRRSIGLAYKAKGGGWRDSEGDWRTRLEPTHWYPLPKPPETNA